MKLKHIFSIFILFVFPAILFGQEKARSKKKTAALIDTIVMYANEGELKTIFNFIKGEEFNHPTFAIWLETTDGEYLETIFVTRSFATATYGHADAGDGTWKTIPGESLRLAALPYWAHKRDVISRDSLYIPTPENPVPDAISGATPSNDFVIMTNFRKKLPQKFVVLFEINQAFDFNEYWTNLKLDSNKDYLTSGQPSIVYAVTIDLESPVKEYFMNPVGHGSASGADGLLYTNINTLSTATQITKELKISIIN